MKIGAVYGQNLSAIAQRANRSLAHQGGGRTAVGARADVLSLSPQGKRQSGALGMLMEQKKSLLERRQELLDRAREDGSSVTEQLKALDEQLRQLDEVMAQQALADLSRPKEEKDSSQEEPQTEQEHRTRQAGAMMEMAAGLSCAQTVDSVRTRLQGELNVLKSELSTSKANTPAKAERVAELEGRLQGLDTVMGAQLGRVFEAEEKSAKVSKEPARAEDEEAEQDNSQEDAGLV